MNVDLVVTVDRLPGPGETVVGPGVRRFGGGKGANAAVAAARAGADVSLVGAVGADGTGAEALDELRADHVDTGSVAVLDGVATGVALIVVDGAGENQIAVGAGANAAVTPAAVSVALTAGISAADGAAAGAAAGASVRAGDGAADRVGSGAGVGCVLVSTEIQGDAVTAAVRGAAAAGITCVLNPAPVIPAVAQLLDAGLILTPNRTECLELAALLGHVGGSGGSGVGPAPAALVVAAASIQARTGAPVVVTLGGDGALIVSADGTEHIAGLPVTVRDTTGAGDTVNGVLAARLAAGDELGDAVRAAVVAASLSVTRTGARDGMPGAAAIATALAEQHRTAR